ncbi:DUF11 domain-containing protein [Streptomyces sp. NBC_01613]|uniref:hypothetical protein n=1 Tax=Streptomyces sp. NBC_01613 TaxID=2975896 RepID=UPI003862E145
MLRRSVCAVVTGVVLAALASCSVETPNPAPATPSITAPHTFYLRPDGDKSGPHDKGPFHLLAADDPGEGVRTLTADVLPGAEGAVRLRRSGDCKGSSTHVVCEVGAEYDNWSDSPRVSPVAAKGSKAGDQGTVRFTYTTKKGQKLTARTRAVVGEPVVEVLTPTYLKGVRPGAEMSEPVVVRNTGEVPVKGLGLELSANNMEFVDEYANCRYPDFSHGHVAVCTFPDLRIGPGEAVVLRPTLKLRASKTDMYTSFGHDVWPLDMGPGQYGSYQKGGDHGDGPTLVAEPVKATKGTYIKGGGSTYVVLDSHADYEVFGVDLHGSPGTKRSFDLTVRNNGPADGGSSTRLIFEPPLGMTMVKQPMDEYDDGVYEPYCKSNGYTYTCDIGGLKPGRSRTFEFTVRLGEPGRGRLSLQDKEPTSSAWYVGRQDPDVANDEAVITVRR